jgi:hypothetical protein
VTRRGYGFSLAAENRVCTQNAEKNLPDGIDAKIVSGCSKRPFSKAATSEDRRRTLWGTLRI